MDYTVRFADQLKPHLRALRRQRHMTQAQLGQLLGLGQPRVAEIEGRPGSISVEQLVQVLSALGVTLVLRDESDDAAKMPARGTARKGSW